MIRSSPEDLLDKLSWSVLSACFHEMRAKDVHLTRRDECDIKQTLQPILSLW